MHLPPCKSRLDLQTLATSSCAQIPIASRGATASRTVTGKVVERKDNSLQALDGVEEEMVIH